MKRILSAAAVLALSASLLVGCSSGTASSVPVSASSAAESTVSSVEETASSAVDEKNKAEQRKEAEARMPLGRKNYLFMLIGLGIIILGFILMSGGGSPDESFNPEVFSTRRIVVGPLLSFLGFLLMAFAILWTPGKKKNG